MLERCDFPKERSVFTNYTYYSSIYYSQLYVRLAWSSTSKPLQIKTPGKSFNHTWYLRMYLQDFLFLFFIVLIGQATQVRYQHWIKFFLLPQEQKNTLKCNSEKEKEKKKKRKNSCHPQGRQFDLRFSQVIGSYVNVYESHLVHRESSREKPSHLMPIPRAIVQNNWQCNIGSCILHFLSSSEAINTSLLIAQWDLKHLQYCGWMEKNIYEKMAWSGFGWKNKNNT